MGDWISSTSGVPEIGPNESSVFRWFSNARAGDRQTRRQPVPGSRLLNKRRLTRDDRNRLCFT